MNSYFTTVRSSQLVNVQALLTNVQDENSRLKLEIRKLQNNQNAFTTQQGKLRSSLSMVQYDLKNKADTSYVTQVKAELR